MPQTINVVTAKQISDQAAQSVSEALRYTPGVSVDNFGALSPTDSYTRVRGFRTDLYQDGIRLPIKGDGAASFAVEPYGLERVEVLKGPASGLYGSSGPGGIINMVSKRPTDVSINEIQLQTGSFNRAQIGFDFSGAATSDKSVLFRLTGLARDADTQVDFAEDNRLFIAPALTFRPSSRTTLTLLANYSEEDSVWSFFNLVPPQGSVLPNPNGRIPRSRYTGEPGSDRLDRYQYSLGYAFEHKFSDDVMIRQNLRYGEVDSQVNAAANIYGFFFDPVGQKMTTRLPIDAYDTADFFAVDNQLLFKARTGALWHDAVVGLDYRNERSFRDFKVGAPSLIDIFNPVYGQPLVAATVPLAKEDADQEQLGLYFQDQVRIGGWLASFGGRYDWVTSDVTNLLAPIPAEVTQKDEKFTGRVGLSYIFDNGFAPYVSYATSFQPVTGLDFQGNAFQPSTGEQYEVGVKYQPVGTNSLFTAALFDLTQQNVIFPYNIGFQRQIGEINVKGLELEAKAEVTREISIVAGYSYLDSEITKSPLVGEIGERPAETPDHQASFWGQYHFYEGQLRGLELAAGVRYYGETNDDSHTLDIADYTLFDARLGYDLAAISPTLAGATLAVNATNIFDKYYVASCFGATATACALGSGRTVLGTLTYRW